MPRSQSPRRSRADEITLLDRRVAELQQERRDEAEQVARFRAALRGSKVGMFNQDRELRYTWVYNPHAGYSSADVLGKTDENLLSPHDAAALTAIKQRVLETGAGESAEVTVTIDGKTVCYDLHVEPMREGSGEITGVMGVAVDITERKRFATAVKEGEERHRALLRAVPDMIFRVERDGTFLEFVPGQDVSPVVQPEDFLGKKMEDVLPRVITEPSMLALERA